MRGALLGLAAVALLCGAANIRAQTLNATSIAPTDGAIEALRPGEYLWAPKYAPARPVTMIVSLNTQRAFWPPARHCL